jgi:hypothetical protein
MTILSRDFAEIGCKVMKGNWTRIHIPPRGDKAVVTLPSNGPTLFVVLRLKPMSARATFQVGVAIVGGVVVCVFDHSASSSA